MAVLPSEEEKKVIEEFLNPPDVCGIQWDVLMAREIIRMREEIDNLKSEIMYLERQLPNY